MVNNINNIYTTVSDGRTHIAADTKYIGTVDSYNNCFTQFFARLFRLSVDVNFDGKIRCINKDSYKQLLDNFGFNGILAPTFRTVAESVTLPNSSLKMRDVISSNDRNTLFQKLAQAISTGNTSKALLMIGKGAELDTSYYDRGHLYPSFYSDTSNLDSESRYSFNVFQAPPILQAAKKANRIVVEFLNEAGANLNATGKEYTFKREIVDVQRNLEWTVQPHLVPHHHYHRGHHHVDYRVRYSPQLHERTTVFTQDSRNNKRNYKLDNDCNLIPA
jgi:hypothetical protein